MSHGVPATSVGSRPGPTGGFLFAGGAFLLWGAFPIYFQLLSAVSPWELVVHRVIWSAAFLAVILSILGGWPRVWAELANRRRLAVYAATTALIGINWFTLIVGITTERVLEVGLGYYINPLVNILAAMVILGERLTRRQGLAIALAAAAVANLVIGYGQVPWISLILAFTFAGYAVLRKWADIPPLEGLMIESLVLTPIAVIYLMVLVAGGTAAFATGTIGLDLLLIGSGIMTAIPLMLFVAAARRLPLSTLGIFGYSAPTLQVLSATLVLGETFTWSHAVTFALIWTALAIYSWPERRRRTTPVNPDPPA